MLTGLQLPVRFDVTCLRADLASVQPDEWVAHYNDRDYGGDWRGVALRSATGSSGDLNARPAGESAFMDTALLDRCAYFRELLAVFQCRLKAVRLLALAPGAFIREHSDAALDFENGEIRIHVPIQTNSSVEFYVDGERLLLEAGNSYYMNANRPHRARNRSGEDRVHLVIDAEVNEWVRHIFRHGRPIERVSPAPASFEEFRKRILADSELQRHLHSIAERRAFLADIVRMGRERGFDFDEEDVESRPPRQLPIASVPPTENWLPIAARLADGEVLVECAYFGTRRLTEPFFDLSVLSVLRNPFSRAFRREIPLQVINADREPSGFIFHMSRCGSTLIAQMFASLERAAVLSEAAPIDDVIQVKPVNAEEHVRWLRSIVMALGQRRAGEDCYFVKLDAWHIHCLPLIREAFPDVPWVFVYRDPVEVLVSQLLSPAKFALPGAMDPAILGLRVEDITGLSRIEWCAQVLAGFCQAALGFRDDPKGMFLNYDQLPGAAWDALPEHFSISLTNIEISRMQQAARSDAKRPASPFVPDSETKRQEAGAAVRDVARLLEPLYLELERARGK